MTISELIIKIEKEQGLNDYQLAKKTGLDQALISRMRRGIRGAGMITLHKLAQTYPLYQKELWEAK